LFAYNTYIQNLWDKAIKDEKMKGKDDRLKDRIDEMEK